MFLVQSNYLEVVDNEKQVVELMRNEWYKSKTELSLDSFRKEYAKHILTMFPNIVLRTKTNHEFVKDLLDYKLMILTNKKPVLTEPENQKVSDTKKSLKSKKK
jgi:hypothetical protein